MTPLQPGTPLCGGKYEITRFLSSGGFGCTYEVRHTALGTRFAIKEFYTEQYCNRGTDGTVSVGTNSARELVATMKERFKREAGLIAKLHHPGVVRVTYVFEENGTAYYVMDYISNGTLRNLVDTQGPMSEPAALALIEKVCGALEYIHSEGLIHLDIKPDNIMLDDKWDPVLIDFGTSKIFIADGEYHTTTTTNVGMTPGYAAPEQYSSTMKAPEPTMDIYALGATLYMMLTGRKPVDAIERVTSGIELSFPSVVPERMRYVINRAMEPQASHRPQNVAEFRRLLSGAGTPPPPPGGSQGTEGSAANDTKVFDGSGGYPGGGYSGGNRGYSGGGYHGGDYPGGNTGGRRSKFPVWIIYVLAASVLALVVFLFINLKTGGDHVSTYDSEVAVDSEVVEEVPADSAPAEEGIAVPATESVDEQDVISCAELNGGNTSYGTVTHNGSDYPIRMEIKVSPSGKVTGRYAYETTLSKNGTKASSWFKLSGTCTNAAEGNYELTMTSYNPQDGNAPFEKIVLWYEPYTQTFSGDLTNINTGSVLGFNTSF